MKLNVKVAPKASRNAVAGWMGDTLKLAVTTAPEKGKANQAVIELLAEALDLPRSAIRILRGETSREKVVEILGQPPGETLRRLGRTQG